MRHILEVAALVTSACGSFGADSPSPVDEAGVMNEVKARVRAYGAVLGPARCQDPEPYYDFWTYERGGVVLAENGRISELDAAAHRTQGQAWFCSVRAQTLTVDTVVVQVLGAETAVATWTFREEVVDTSGAQLRIRGDVMQPWIRLGGRWRSTGLVATHEVTPVGSR